jgi:hypothetical protein
MMNIKQIIITTICLFAVRCRSTVIRVEIDRQLPLALINQQVLWSDPHPPHDTLVTLNEGFSRDRVTIDLDHPKLAGLNLRLFERSPNFQIHNIDGDRILGTLVAGTLGTRSDGESFLGNRIFVSVKSGRLFVVLVKTRYDETTPGSETIHGTRAIEAFETTNPALLQTINSTCRSASRRIFKGKNRGLFRLTNLFINQQR